MGSGRVPCWAATSNKCSIVAVYTGREPILAQQLAALSCPMIRVLSGQCLSVPSRCMTRMSGLLAVEYPSAHSKRISARGKTEESTLSTLCAQHKAVDVQEPIPPLQHNTRAPYTRSQSPNTSNKHSSAPANNGMGRLPFVVEEIPRRCCAASPKLLTQHRAALAASGSGFPTATPYRSWHVNTPTDCRTLVREEAAAARRRGRNVAILLLGLGQRR